MRTLAFLLPLILLASCSSSPERAKDNAEQEKEAAEHTDECLANPESADAWGECNVKHTLYLASEQLAKCRNAHPSAKGVVNFELKVRGDGKVKSAKLSKGKYGKLGNCLTKVMKGLQFAPTSSGKEATISVPYQLEP